MSCMVRILLAHCCALLASFTTVGQWLQTNGPYGGIINTFNVGDTNLFVGTEGRGVYRSTDSGTNWTAMNIGLPLQSVLAFAESRPYIFAGGGGVYRSTNNGVSWIRASTGLPIAVVRTLAVSGTTLFAGGSYGVSRSTNNGTSWTAVNNGLPLNTYVYALAVGDTNLFTATSNGVFRSTNNGTSWISANKGLPLPLGSRESLFSLVISGTNLFAGND